jgi:hypothetical protein
MAGPHSALVELETDGKGGFSGKIESNEFGDGAIGGVVTGDHYTGSILLDGHTAKFSADVSNGAINGTITAGWFFSLDFTGKEAA